MKTTMLHMIQTKTKAPNEFVYVCVYVKYLVLKSKCDDGTRSRIGETGLLDLHVIPCNLLLPEDQTH